MVWQVRETGHTYVPCLSRSLERPVGFSELMHHRARFKVLFFVYSNDNRVKQILRIQHIRKM